MEKLTMTRKEVAELLGISRGTVTRWVLEGRLKAYRISDRPRAPLLFTREDCIAALQAVPVEPVLMIEREMKREKEESFFLRRKDASKELDALLKIRTGKSRKVE
ncbi:helix-turn-helix domain-containing protein [Enterobacter roggenkampii]|uniref:helix-turn-helix domain-containing protein n=1 Tax=Enterobacter roggenkampii TaxID=1812935 RepID=UPI0010178562|nr:helix-turn-helix domain-containing protein [Enterobacter roggenkampii]QBA41151.1 helix-turn-helix domain-containing protein [Enterobacter roggenkampii]HAS0880918.1 excisionase family DNA-binding protein [Enterobacter roggenkampii]